MMRNFVTSLVRTFVTVADTASMTAAANALHLTQGAVSQQVRRLEEALGCSPFERDQRGLRLTLAGERLFSRAKRLLSLNDEIWAEMTTDAVEGGVRLGVPPDLVGTRLAPVLKAYADAFPRVEISLLCGPSPDLARVLASGQVDLALVKEPVGPIRGRVHLRRATRLGWCQGRRRAPEASPAAFDGGRHLRIPPCGPGEP